MKTPLVWTNDKTALFKAGTPPIFLGFSIGVTDISWHNEDAWVTLVAQLPEGGNILNITNGDTLEIVYKDCGALEDPTYESDEVIIRMEDCIVQGKSIEHVVPISPDGYDNDLTLNMFLECNLELNFGKTHKFVSQAKLPSILNVRCACSKCGWSGTVWDCESDFDNNWILRCPECETIIEVKANDKGG